MRILAIDTALAEISVGLDAGGAVSAQSFRHERDALRRLMGIVRDLLSQAHLSPEDLDVIACTRGPGSFTGLRVGIAGAKALADSCGAAMVGVSTLAMLAARVSLAEDEAALALIPCCPGELYCGLYGPDGKPLADDTVLHAADVKDWAIAASRAHGLRPVAAGPALAKSAPAVDGLKTQPEVISVDVRDILRAARGAAEAGAVIPALDFQPDYLRASQAEVRAAAKKV